MNRRFELRYGDKVIQGEPEELHKITIGLKCYWEMYMVVPSTMKEGHSRKMDILDMREAKRKNERGYSQKVLAKQYGVSEEYMSKVLRQLSVMDAEPENI